jgi:xylulokinase
MAATGAGAEVATLPQIARTIDPDPSLKDSFDAGHARFRAAQSAIKDLT